MENNIISYIERKHNSQQERFYLGPELRYIGALTTSNNNNLEEQFLFGVDKIVTSQTDNENNIEKEIIEFRREGDNEYYILDKTKFLSSSDDDMYIVQDEDLQAYKAGFNDNFQFENNTLKQINYKNNIGYNDSTQELILNPITVIEQDILKYHKENGVIIEILEKIISSEIVDNKKVTTEKIIKKI